MATTIDARAARTRIRKRPSYLSRKSAGDIIFDILNHAFLAGFALTIVYPFWVTILTSFSDVDSASSLGLKLWIPEWQLAAYRYAFSSYGNVGIAYANSIFRTVVGTLLSVSATVLMAYPLSKKEIPFRNAMTIFLLITMFFSGGLIPTYLLVRNLGLIDSRWALILPQLVVGFNVIITRNFLMSLDRAFEESAFMDGANYLQILTRIVVPLSKPVIATISLWIAVFHWNSWFDALIYINDESKIVLQLLLRRLIQQMNMAMQENMQNFMLTEQVEMPTAAVRAAITILTIGPIVFFYPFLQKYFVKGVLLGSLKG